MTADALSPLLSDWEDCLIFFFVCLFVENVEHRGLMTADALSPMQRVVRRVTKKSFDILLFVCLFECCTRHTEALWQRTPYHRRSPRDWEAKIRHRVYLKLQFPNGFGRVKLFSVFCLFSSVIFSVIFVFLFKLKLQGCGQVKPFSVSLIGVNFSTEFIECPKPRHKRALL